MACYHNSLTRFVGVSLTSAILLAGAASPSCAQDATSSASNSGKQIEEVVVTATKSRELLSKVPISIAAFDQTSMDEQGIRQVDDLAREVPGVDFSRSPFGGGTGSQISIRGISSNTGASTTGIYIDDVPIQTRANQESFIGASFPEVFDLQRVEVVRGPQGTLWGAGAEGGAIRFITPQPGLSNYDIYGRSEVSATVNGDPSYEAGAAVGGPIVADKLGFRVSGWYRHDGGYVDRKNIETGTVSPNSNYQDSIVSRLALLYSPHQSLRITPSFSFQDVQVNDTSGFWGSLSNPGAGKFVNGHVLREPTRDTFYLPSLKVEQDFDGMTLTSISSYYYRKADMLADDTNFESVIWTGNPYPALPGQNAPAFVGTFQNVVSQEVRLQSQDPDAALKWTVGVFYSDAREADYNLVEDVYLDQLLENAFGLNVAQFFGTPLAGGKYTFIGRTVSHDKQIAGFGQIDYKPIKDLTLTAGLRVASTKFSYVQFYGGPVNYSGSGPTTKTLTGGESETPVTPKFGASYQLNEGNLLYVSVGEGYRIGGANTPVPLNPACKADLARLGLSSGPAQYQSDNVWSYEAGVKSRSDNGRFSVDASAFHIDWQNIQQYVGLPDCGGIGFTGNLGSATSNGFDLQAQWLATDNLRLNAAIGYTNATYSKAVGSNGTIVVDKGDVVGVPPTGITPWTIHVGAEYSFTVFGNRSAYFHVDDDYRSHVTGRSANLDNPLALGYDPNIPFDPATNELNMRLGMLVGNLDVSIFGNNLLNSHPKLQRTHDIPGSPLYYYNTLRPLTAGVTVTYRD